MSQSANIREREAVVRRLIGFEYDLTRRASELVEPIEDGALVLSPELDLLWRANYLQLEATERGAAALAAQADELMGARGLRHRSVVPLDPALGDRLEPGFRELGWGIERSLYMVLRRSPEREGAAAVEVARERIEPVRRAVAMREPDRSEAVTEQLLISDARLDELGNGHWFAADHDGSPASACVLYERDGVGQVETVITLTEARGRGLASGVVLAAVDASRQAGHELTFIVADADDWPWRLYERLGFDPVGLAPSFLRKPEGGR
jgi:ribosomal protein S18 acetylase RimI-like enzyme